MWIFDIAFNDAIHSNWYYDTVVGNDNINPCKTAVTYLYQCMVEYESGPNKENDFLQTNHALMYFWNWFSPIQLIFREICRSKCLFSASIGKYFYTFGESFLQAPTVSINGGIDGLIDADWSVKPIKGILPQATLAKLSEIIKLFRF